MKMQPLRTWRGWLHCLLLLASSLLTLAQAVEITIDTDPDDDTAQLELRNVTLPDGESAELYIIRGSPVRVTLDGDEIIANYLEFDLANRVLRIVGAGSYRSADDSEFIEGEDFTINLDDGAFVVRDVLIITGDLDILGVDATRLPERIEVQRGVFSPCARCGQRVEDYGFRASRLRLYPGDRLVAYNVTVLLRERGAMFLPLMVVPLGPAERQPRLSFRLGTATSRAEVSLSWPYVVGADAFGVSTLRYYADVVPGEGNFFSENFLGGGVETAYLGGGIVHRFFSDVGSGVLEFNYLPSFLDDSRSDGRRRDEWRYRLRYTTDEALDIPQSNLLIERDDSRRQRIVEYLLELEDSQQGLRGRFSSQGYIDLDPDDDVTTPSYSGRTIPERSYSRLRLDLVDNPSLQVGPFRARDLELDIGIFEDSSNPSNRSAAVFDRITAARLLQRFNLELTTLRPWQDLSLSGDSRFTGQYYSSGERLIEWNSRLELEQRFPAQGSLRFRLQRNYTEGETPFRFDVRTLRSRTDLRTSFSITPSAWLNVSLEHDYVFVDNRNPEELGFGAINTTLRFFDNINWLRLSVRNSFDFDPPDRAERGIDPGEIDSELAITSPFRNVRGSVTLRHVQDLRPGEDRLAGVVRDTSFTSLSLDINTEPWLRFQGNTRYTYDPIPNQNDDVLEFWEPLDLSLSSGSLSQDARLPGVRVSYIRDLNRNAMRELGVEARARVAMFEINLQQRWDFQGERDRLSRAEYRLTWRNVLSFEARGFALLPSAWVGAELDPMQSRTLEFRLRDETVTNNPLWRLSYAVTQDPRLNQGEGGLRNRRLEAFVDVVDTTIFTALGPIRLGVDFFSELRLADDEIDRSYLNRASLELSSDFFGRVGIQGALAYTGSYSVANQEITRAALTLDNFGVVVRPTNELFVAMLFNDVWDLAGDGSRSDSGVNFQPTFYIVYDRCCWALYGSWNSSSGEISIALSAAGAEQGLEQILDVGLQLPGRGAVRGNP